MRPHSAKKEVFNFSAYKGIPDHTTETYKMFLIDEMARDLANEQKSLSSNEISRLKYDQISVQSQNQTHNQAFDISIKPRISLIPN